MPASRSSAYQTKNGIVDAAECVKQEVQRDRTRHQENKDSHTINFAGLIAEKVGHNCFHHRIPDLEMTDGFMGLCLGVDRVLTERGNQVATRFAKSRTGSLPFFIFGCLRLGPDNRRRIASSAAFAPCQNTNGLSKTKGYCFLIF
jgi:hypothetical protein